MAYTFIIWTREIEFRLYMYAAADEMKVIAGRSFGLNPCWLTSGAALPRILFVGMRHGD